MYHVEVPSRKGGMELKEFVANRVYKFEYMENIPENIDDTIEMLEARESQMVREILYIADEITRG